MGAGMGMGVGVGMTCHKRRRVLAVTTSLTFIPPPCPPLRCLTARLHPCMGMPLFPPGDAATLRARKIGRKREMDGIAPTPD